MRYFVLIFTITFTQLFASIPLEEQKIKGRDWLVLGFVQDSDSSSAITSLGHELRKKIEVDIQNLGGEIFTLRKSERRRLESLWSKPFTGRLNEQLKKFGEANQINILTGSYAKNKPEEITMLIFNYQLKKVKVLYQHTEEKGSLNHLQNIEDKNTERNEQEEGKLFRNPFQVKPLESVRRKPESFERRNSRRYNVGKQKNAIVLHLRNNPVLNKLREESKKLSKEKVIGRANDLIQRAEESWMTTSKLELYSRAWVLLDILKDYEKEKDDLVDQILEHEKFFDDRNSVD